MLNYTGGSNKWGTMIRRCDFCGEIISEYECDEDGGIINTIFDDDNHICEDDYYEDDYYYEDEDDHED